MADLKLIALDEEDLSVLSAHLQDAVLKVGEITFQAKEKRFAAVVNRFDWEGELKAGSAVRKKHERRRSGLRFERVLAARTLRIDLTKPDDVLSLLAVTFEVSDTPAGRLTMNFSGGMAIELDVECIEGELRDLGAAWATDFRPLHKTDGEA
ncbi:MAG: DUF2948 family protein [Pseudomonadota bacterium]